MGTGSPSESGSFVSDAADESTDGGRSSLTQRQAAGRRGGRTISDEPSARDARPPLWRRIHPYYLIITFVYLAFTTLSITSSSVASPLLQEDPGITEGTLLFEPQIIRTDEYLTSTPILLSFIANGGDDGFTPLAQEPDLIYQVPSGSLFESFVFFDGTALRLSSILPDAMLFAGFWWLPTYIVAMALPFWLQRLGSRVSLSYLAVALFAFAPATQWWSMIPTRVLAFPLLACVLVMLGVERLQARKRATGILLCVLAGPLVSRIATNYVPWALTISIPVVLATVLWLLWHKEKRARRPAWIGIGIGAASTVIFFGMLLVENLDSIRSELSTVYPGLRASGSGYVPIAHSFGAPELFNLHTYYPSHTNQSELSSSFGIMLIVLLVVLLLERGWRRQRSTGAVVLLTAASAGWLLWSLVDLGAWTASIPLLNRVPPTRAAATFGYIAIFALMIVLSRYTRTRVRTYLTAAILAGALTTLAGRDASRTFQATLTTEVIILVAACTAITVGLLVALPRSRIVAAVVAVAALATTVQVNPLQHGLADLRDSDLAEYLVAEAPASIKEGEYWVSDSPTLDSVLTASGVNHLSGNQVTGPVKEQWRLLDPTDQYINAWNRGASYLAFEFTDNDTPTIINPDGVPDRIVVQVNPCALPELGFDLKYVVTTNTLEQSCATQVAQFDWNSVAVRVYELELIS